MFSVRTFTIGLALAGAALAGAAQAGVVVSSSGPSKAQFPSGKKLDDNSSITLRDGHSVTVLTAGGTRVIKGAGAHLVGEPAHLVEHGVDVGHDVPSVDEHRGTAGGAHGDMEHAPLLRDVDLLTAKRTPDWRRT